MIRQSILFILSFLTLSSIAIAASPPKSKERVWDLPYFKSNFKTLYANEYDKFFVFYNQQEALAQKCDDPEKLGEFLSFGKLIEGNVEVSEAFSESIERMFIDKQTCFEKGFLSVDKMGQRIICDRLKNPTFLDEDLLKKKLSESKICKSLVEK